MGSKARAPTLWGIIVFKFVKALLFLSIAFGIYTLIDNNLPADFRRLLQWLHVDPEKTFWSEMAGKLAKVTPKNIMWIASGTVLYGSISMLESIGLMFRKEWAGWLAIAEGAFFIPIEVYELSHKFTIGLGIILFLNIIIVFYLYRNRDRLFHHGAPSAAKPSRK